MPRAVAWGKQAGIISQYAKKGSLIRMQGRLQTRSRDQDRTKHYKTEIVVEAFQLGPKSSKLAGDEAPIVSSEEEKASAEMSFPRACLSVIATSRAALLGSFPGSFLNSVEYRLVYCRYEFPYLRSILSREDSLRVIHHGEITEPSNDNVLREILG